MNLTLTVNGQTHHLTDLPEEASLLEVLREHLHITSPKDGCSPQGQCGCCTVMVDGHVRTACASPAKKCDGKSVTTLEGLAADERTLLADAFARTGGLQCGFCIPGIALRAKALADRYGVPDRETIAKGLDTHLCRCTGYVKIIDAIELYARVRQGEALPEADYSGKVGTRLPKYEAEAMTLGDRAYVADMKRPDMLHGAVRLADHPRARVLKIDATRALAMPGVHRVFTAADVPGKLWYGIFYTDWPGFIAEGEVTHCVGSVVAAVTADSERIAREAAAAIDVTYEVLEPVLDPHFALTDAAPLVNEAALHGNLLGESGYKRGDWDAARAATVHEVEGTWNTQRIEHLFLEPEACLAEPWETDGVRLYSQGQGIFDDQRQIASFLSLPVDKVFVTLVPNGGAFGGKEDMSIQAHAALMAKLTGRPVRLVLTRGQSVRMHPKRHPIEMHYRVGCDAEGRLTYLQAKMIGDSGAYASVGAKVLERAAGHACGPYRIPAAEVEAKAVYTNNVPCGAMRGFGANQAAFALEGCLDRLAEKVGIDGWEMRWRNVCDQGDTFGPGQVLKKPMGLRDTLLAVKDTYRAAKFKGIACGIKNCGIGNGVLESGRARLVVEPDGRVTLYNGYTEMGQGLLTICIQIASDITGVDPRLIDAKVDTTFALGCGQTTGSRATVFSGNAVAIAARRMREALDAGETLSTMVGRVFEGDFLDQSTTRLDVPDPTIHLTFGFATQVAILDDAGRLSKFVAAHDVGRAINPMQCQGQIEGSVHMGIGYALTEELPTPGGFPATDKLRGIGVLRAQDMPEVEVILVECPEPQGPYGARGVGEIGLVPTAGAVAAALHSFDGVWRDTLPMKNSPAARACRAKPLEGGVPCGD
jgi:xanthine dehydrogenase molybdenum-binding subunit